MKKLEAGAPPLMDTNEEIIDYYVNAVAEEPKDKWSVFQWYKSETDFRF